MPSCILLSMRVVGRGDLQERTWAGIFSTFSKRWILELGKWDPQFIYDIIWFNVYINNI